MFENLLKSTQDSETEMTIEEPDIGKKFILKVQYKSPEAFAEAKFLS